jgi:hypothetical protein
MPRYKSIKQLYRSEVLGLPGPTDRWLTTNEHAGNISFLRNYLFLHDLTNIENVLCHIQRVVQHHAVSATFLSAPAELIML